MRYCGAVVLIFWLMTSVAAGRADPQTLWRIGAPDNDYREFALAGQYGEYLRRFPKDATYRIGESRPERDWPYILPGKDDAWAGSRTHPFRIQFDLDEVPQGVYRLVIDAVNTHYGHPPLLEIAINGRAAYRFQMPAGTDDRSLTDPRAGREYVLTLPFPSWRLKPGRNVLTLTTVAGSWLLFDTLWLESGILIPSEPVITDLRAETTMLYRRIGGELKQAVRVSLNNAGIEGRVEVSLTGAPTQTVSLLPGPGVFYLFLAPLERPTPLRLSVRTESREEKADFVGRPERRWRVFVAPSAHTDIGYTDLQERTFARHNENTAIALRACAQNPAFAWNLEVAHQAVQFRRDHPRDYPALVERLRRGQIGLQGLYLNMLTGLCSGEEMAQAVTRAKRLGRETGFPVVSANLSDVPSSVGTLPMLLSQAGIRYFAEAVNQYRGPLFRHADRRMQQSPFWWEGLDGSRVLAIFTHGYAQASALGLPHSVEEVARRLPDWLRGFDRADYPYDAVYAYGGFSDNELLNPRYGEVAAEWNRQWEYPKVVISRVDAFFRYVEQKYGARLPVFRGDAGVYWEDGAASSALETAQVRRAKARLESAERLYALAALRQPKAFPASALQAAWDAVLFYDEHTWGAWCSISQPDSEQTRQQWLRKAAYARQAAERSDALSRSAVSAIRQALSLRKANRSSTARAITVLNEHSWPRDLLVSIPVSPGEKTLCVREAGRAGRLLAAQRSGNLLLFVAEKVPPMGFRSYRVEPGRPPQAAPILRQGADEWTWETADFRLRFDPETGAIARLENRRTGEPWVEMADGYGLNQFLYVRGGEGSRMIQPDTAEPTLRIHTHTQARLRPVENGPVRATLRLERRGPDAPPTDTRVRFYRDGRIEFVNVVRKAQTLAKEAGYFAFPFRFRRPAAVEAYTELPYGVLCVEKEQLPGGCREWYTTNSFAALSDGRATAYLAAPHSPLLTFGDIFRGQWRGKLGPFNGRLFAYVFNNYWDTNYKAAQGGELVFAFSLRLRAGAFDPVEATRFGWERLSSMPDPLKAAEETGEGGWFAGTVGAAEGSLLRVDGKQVVVGGLTRDRNFLHIRLYNPARQPAHIVLALPEHPLREAWRADLVGAREKRLPLDPGKRTVAVTVPARSVVTVCLR